MQTDQKPETTFNFKSTEDLQVHYNKLTKDLSDVQEGLYQLSYKISERINVIYQAMTRIGKQVAQEFKDSGKLMNKDAQIYFLNYKNKGILDSGYSMFNASHPINLHYDSMDSFMIHDNNYLLDFKLEYHNGTVVSIIEYPTYIDSEGGYLNTETAYIPADWLSSLDESWEDEYRQVLVKAVNDKIQKLEIDKQNTKERKLELFNKLKTELGL